MVEDFKVKDQTKKNIFQRVAEIFKKKDGALSNKELTPEEQVVYLFRRADNQEAGAYGRIRNITFALSVDRDGADEKLWNKKQDHIVRAVRNSMALEMNKLGMVVPNRFEVVQKKVNKIV